MICRDRDFENFEIGWFENVIENCIRPKSLFRELVIVLTDCKDRYVTMSRSFELCRASGIIYFIFV